MISMDYPNNWTNDGRRAPVFFSIFKLEAIYPSFVFNIFKTSQIMQVSEKVSSRLVALGEILMGDVNIHFNLCSA